MEINKAAAAKKYLDEPLLSLRGYARNVFSFVFCCIYTVFS